MKKIKLITDFTDCPCGRYRQDGPGSGQEFRECFLEPALEKYGKIEVDLDGADALPPGFLDEAFGIMVEKMGRKLFDECVTIILTDDITALRKLNQQIELRTKK